MPGEEARDAWLTLQQEINREQKQILDRLYAEVEQRSQQIKGMNVKCGFLTQVDYLRNAANDQRIHESIDTLCEVYDEIIAQDLKNEVQSLRRRLRSYEEITSREVNNWGPVESHRTTSVVSQMGLYWIFVQSPIALWIF